MSAVVTKSRAISRRFFLKGVTALSQSRVLIGLPPLAAMFNSAGTAYAAETKAAGIPTRFVLWFNGNGISEKYWIPRETGDRFHVHTLPRAPCTLSRRHSRGDWTG